MAGDAHEVSESIEVGAESQNLEIDDAGTSMETRHGGRDADINLSVEKGSEKEVKAEGEVDAEEDADREADDLVPAQTDIPARRLLQVIKETSEYLCEYKIKEDGEEREIAEHFQRRVNKRSLPDYFEVIKDPVAFSTVRQKLVRKQYTAFNEFVVDVARICHNAQVYNRPSAPVFADAAALRTIFKNRLKEMVGKGVITAQDAEIPYLGELPDVEDPWENEAEDDVEEDADEEDDEEEADEEEDENESEEEGGRRRGRKRRRVSGAKQESRDDEDAHKRRGRPPKVFTPLEARIQSLLKGLRKVKTTDGQLCVTHFEKLPDKAAMPTYYDAIRHPIALDVIKKNHKRKKYQNLDQVLEDLNLMFENAKSFNEEDSPVHAAAVELQEHARISAELEKAKPDDVFYDEDGRRPLTGIEFRGEVWRIGDWVHIQNPNDLSKPIVAQIFRTWADQSGQKWVNACWYYRPEQTVHRYDKHFYENEVVKTGQYRDHRIEEIEDRCFVMFITRFHKGRPRTVQADKTVYVCEARYNEEKYRFNKIKTWTSCLPDEMREHDYEMDLFLTPRPMKKNPSPIKHLLQSDAKETDEPPKPSWRNSNAPPLIGAVHCRPRAPNESPPPPQKFPPAAAPAPLVTEPSRRLSAKGDMGSSTGGPNFHRATPATAPVSGSVPGHYMQPFARQGPLPAPPSHTYVQPQPIPAHVSQPSHVGHHGLPQAQASPHFSPQPYAQQAYTPQTPQPGPPVPQYQQPQAPHPSHSSQSFEQHRSPYVHAAMTTNRASIPSAVAAAPVPHGSTPANVYNAPRPAEVYTLTDSMDAAFSEETRQLFQQDDNGRVLFFTAPPLSRPRNRIAEPYAGLGHSVSYLAGLRQRLEERARKRKEREEAEMAAQAAKSPRPDEMTLDSQGPDQQVIDLLAGRILDWSRAMVLEGERLKEDLADWHAIKAEDAEGRR